MIPRPLLTAVLLTGLALACPVRGELPRYSVTLVGDLYPGLTPPVEYPAGLTAAGGVVYSSALPGQAYGITLPGGGRTDIPRIPGAVGYGTTGGVQFYNAAGQFTASAYDNTFETNSTSLEPHAYTPGSGWSTLGKPGGTNAIATAINISGQVIAAGLDAGNDEATAWRHTPGTGWQNLGNLGHSTGLARAADINDAGTVAGWAANVNGDRVPFMYTDSGGMQPITDNGTELFGEARAINNAGLVTGNANGRVFLFNAATMEIKYVTSTGNALRAVDINESGAILGVSGSGSFGFVTLWTEEIGLVSLSSLLIGNEDPFHPAWLMNDAVDINDNGWILGTAQQVSDNTFHQVLLRPVPEPSAALLLCVGAVITNRRLRRPTT